MLADNSRNAHRCVALMMGVVFAAATSTQVSAQSRIDRLSQSSTEIPTASGGGQSVQTLGGQLAVFLGHEGKVNSAVFSPDGSKVLTASHDKTARLWDTKGNLLTLFQGHEDFVRNAVFSPNGSQILTASGDGTVRLWDTKGNLLTLFQGHKNEFASVLFSPDGSQILTARGDNTAHLWDTSGNLLAEFQHEGNVTSAVFNPDGSQILTARGDNTAHLWDTSGNLLAEFQHEGNVTSAVFNPDGSQILTASLDGTARLWNHSGNLLAEFQHEESVLSAVFNPDGSQILTTSWDRTVRLWDSSGNLIAEFGRYEILETISAAFSPDGSKIITVSNTKTTHLWDTKGNLLVELKGDMDEVKSLETQTDVESISSAVFSPDSSQILTTNSDKTVRLWDISAAIAAQTEQISALQAFHKGVSDNNAQLARFQGHEGDITDVVFSPDGSQILTSSYDKTARLWDTKGDLLVEFQGHEGYVFSAVFSRDGNQILTASSDNTARLWDTKGNLLAVLQGYEGFILNAVFSPDGRHIITNSENGTARLWDTKGNLLTIFQEGHAWINSAVFSPDGSQILTASMDGTVCLWDTSGNLLAEFQDYEISLFSAVFSPDGSQILTASADGTDGTARLWDTSGNLLVVFQGHKDSVTSAVFSPDGNQILTASDDGTARLWDTSGNLLTVFQGHEKEVNSAIFSPDGSQILTASADRTIRLWDIKGNALVIFRGHEEKLFSAVFSPDSRQIITGSSDNTARLWDVPAAIAAQADQLATLQAFRTGVSENNAQQAAAALEEGIQLNQQGTIELRRLAIQKLEESLELYREDNNHVKVAQILLSIGNIHANLGQFQTALDSYNQALPLSQQTGSQATEAAIFNSLGQLYNELADPQTALKFYNKALPLLYQLNDKGGAATTLNNIAATSITLGQQQNALDSYNQAFTISRTGGDKSAEANAHQGIGNIYTTSKNWSTALNAYNQALIISRYLNDKVKETTILNQIGKVHASSGQESTAQDYYNQALTLSQQLGYKSEEANILYNQATLNRQQNNLNAAKTEIETAINIIEQLRTQIASQQLRQSYFARNQDYYQFYIDLLMQLHQQNPNKGYDAEALHISERARARSLIELLTEANADIRSGVDSQLLEQERTLTQQLNDLEYRKYQLLSTQHSQTELDDIQQKIDTILTQLNQLEAKIRIASPRYAELKYPEPLTLQQIQQQVLDEDTVLLEYSLGEERSYLWVVTKNNITTYQLPPRSEIETAAKSFFSLTTDSRATIDEILPVSTQLTQLILPNLPQLSQKRLLIVPDGQLHYIPFSALSINPSDYQPLLTKHQVIHLPSASTVAINRNQLTQRAIAPNTLAIIADPIFSLNDERFNGKTNPSSNNNRGTENLASLSLERSATTSDIEFKPLPFTRTEADTILQLLPGKSSLSFFEFDANLNTVKRPDLSNYQIIHFATHGVLNPDYPELSGLVVSLVDRQGNPQNGFLRLNDIFNLNLPAELVVLSACQTGSGENVKGEGIVGLTRGFMYAGSPRVIASLWNVNDASTAELMKLFYQKYLQENLPPAEALRQAQLAMWQSDKEKIDWRTPYFWAAFTLQGEWR